MDLLNADPDIIKVKQILQAHIMKDNNLEFVLNNVWFRRNEKWRGNNIDVRVTLLA